MIVIHYLNYHIWLRFCFKKLEEGEKKDLFMTAELNDCVEMSLSLRGLDKFVQWAGLSLTQTSSDWC